MANTIFPKFKEACISGGSNTNLSSGDVKVVLVDLADYTYSATHEFLSDVPSGARVATTGNLASKTVTNGTFDAADVALPDTGGDQAEALIVYVDTGVEGTSRLFCYHDTGVTGFPITPDSVADTIQWHASGIAAL